VAIATEYRIEIFLAFAQKVLIDEQVLSNCLKKQFRIQTILGREYFIKGKIALLLYLDFRFRTVLDERTLSSVGAR